MKIVLNDYSSDLLVVFNMNFGHTDPQIIVPSGSDVQIDCKTKTIEFL